MTRRRRRRGPPRCNSCGRRIVFLLAPTSGSWRTFEPEPVDGRTWAGGEAYPTEGSRTYRYRDLVEELLVRRQCSRGEAEDEAYAMPWHVVHHCPPGTGPAPAVNPTATPERSTAP